MPPRQPRLLLLPTATAGIGPHPFRAPRRAQPARAPRLARRACAVAAGVACAAGVHAQQAPGLLITPTLTVQETLTDNRDLSSTNRQADLITQVSPGLRVSSRSGRLTGDLSLSLNALHYARANDRDPVTLQPALDSKLHFDAFDGRFYVDAAAAASQQSVSPFGVQSAGTGVYANRSQVTTVSVAPGLRSRIGDWATLDVRLNGSKTDTSDTTLGDATNYGAQATVGGGRIVGWSLSANEQHDDFKVGRSITTQQLNASLSWAPRYDMRFSVRAGRARSDAVAADPVWVQTSGWSASWQPTDRSDIALNGDRAYFGRSHSVIVRHRMARSVWNYTDTKGVSGDTRSQFSVAPLTIYDLLFSICMRSLNDATLCDAQVRSALAQQGFNPAVVVGGGLLASGLTVQRIQNLSFSWSLQRQTVSVSVFRTSTGLLDAGAPAVGDLALGVPIRQHGATLSVSHQLTPTSSLALSGSVQTTPDAGSRVGNELRVATLSWAGTVTARTSFSLTARHSDFESPSQPYRESALIGTLNFTF